MYRLILFAIIFSSPYAFSSESSVYNFSWLDKDKEIYVLQNRKFRKKSNVYVGATLGKLLSGAFIDSNEFNVMGGFFLNEDFGFEVSYTKASGEENTTSEAVNLQGVVPFYRKIESASSIMLLWSPFYSKINTFNKIFYYDWMIGGGMSSVTTIDNRNVFPGGSLADLKVEETISGFTWMTALRFYITEHWSTRIDYRATHLNAEFAVKDESVTTGTEKRWSHYYNLNIGLNYTF